MPSLSGLGRCPVSSGRLRKVQDRGVFSRRLKPASFKLTLSHLSQAWRLGGLRRRIRAMRVAFTVRFITLSSEPDLQLSLHPALQGFNSLRFFRSLHFRSHGTFTALLLLVDYSTTFNPLPSFAL